VAAITRAASSSKPGMLRATARAASGARVSSATPL
jgi:hypothetical protein